MGSGCPRNRSQAARVINRNDKWEAVCKAFTDRGLSDDDALLNARLAKILRQEDYDLTNSQPILWNLNYDRRFVSTSFNI